jgi:hypothetical protein
VRSVRRELPRDLVSWRRVRRSAAYQEAVSTVGSDWGKADSTPAVSPRAVAVVARLGVRTWPTHYNALRRRCLVDRAAAKLKVASERR